ncbi:MAG: PQQ-dependent sugar dehydrogenase, partial [Bacteroidetes bacterium]|nr:PQQ-dependent sugar dehydrogenase [Bacteroidota bacterium]
MRSLFLLVLVGVFFSCSSPEPKVLLYASQEQLKDEENQRLLSAVAQQLEEQKTAVVRADSLGFMAEEQLKDYNALVFFSFDPRQFSHRQQTELERFVQAGGNLVLLNLEADTLGLRYTWPWFTRLVRELGQSKQAAKADAGQESTLPSLRYDGGRISYVPATAARADSAPATAAVVAAIQAAADTKKPDFSKASALPVPDENRFLTITLDNDLNEPMQMAILPDQRVLFIEREGLVKLYKPDEDKTRVIARFKVSTEGNYEDGMLGVAADPAFASNGWVYIYYSPQGGKPKQNLSRFKMAGDSLLMQSEKIVLEVPVQRETCCHSAGAIEFGPDGYLYLSTGDNTSSKESNGYTPIDERPGRSPFDAQKSSGNTRDLRGKILRIKLEEDGTYSIPEGNLFAKDGKEGRPEIYVMGARNPFRFTVDPANGYVYWGDVGPDGGEDGIQGPQSYDEWNQARKPGNYGWPYFVGDNKAYPDWDFTTETPGPKFDPQRPVNESPNNTGSKVLPPAQPALIWYPYGESEEFPMLGTGSRSAMGGPFYHAKQYGNSENKFPAYYNGKWFIYEWARSWIKVVSFDKDQRLEKIEPFMPQENWVKPIDMR